MYIVSNLCILNYIVQYGRLTIVILLFYRPLISISLTIVSGIINLVACVAPPGTLAASNGE